MKAPLEHLLNDHKFCLSVWCVRKEEEEQLAKGQVLHTESQASFVARQSTKSYATTQTRVLSLTLSTKMMNLASFVTIVIPKSLNL
jgi:hypothetical protein